MDAKPNLTCPVCGDPNACAPAATGSLASPCWCTEVVVDSTALARVSENQREEACLCARCASGQTPPERPVEDSREAEDRVVLGAWKGKLRMTDNG
jgi:hypothetical protein